MQKSELVSAVDVQANTLRITLKPDVLEFSELAKQLVSSGVGIRDSAKKKSISSPRLWPLPKGPGQKSSGRFREPVFTEVVVSELLRVFKMLGLLGLCFR